MSVRIENKKQNIMSCLDIQVIGDDKKFTTSVYFKPTFSGVYTHWESFLPCADKFGTVFTFAYRCLWYA